VLVNEHMIVLKNKPHYMWQYVDET